MKNKLIIFLSLILLIGCREKQDNVISTKDDLYNLFLLNNYQVNRKNKLNDSIIQFEGENDRFKIKGKYNFLKKYKTGWWKVYDKKRNEKYLDVDFFMENDKEKKNQIIFYRNNKIDTSNSKFYTKEYSAKNILYKFYCSKSNNPLYSANVNIGIIAGKPLLYPTDFRCENIKNGVYQYSLNISKYEKYQNLNIIGLFSEYLNNKSKREITVDQIFIDDTIKINSSLP